MNLFKRANSIVGWICFAIATITYLLTIEPTASLWDCGEFIATAYKLEVGHPPGNPLFLLIARFFTLFAFGNASWIPVTVNVMSALCSSFTILILFWTITHIARKMLVKTTEDYTLANTIAIIGAGVVGSLAYTFSDTFWFSAIEGEVYAMSSLFTALTFWAILKWEDRVGEPYANRWLILIAYLIGLSIGVHLLNLLTIPAIGLVYYFKLYKPTIRGTLAAFMLSCLIVLGVMLLIPAIPTVISWFELLFVNTFGAPYNTGTAVGFLALVGSLFFACYYTSKRRYKLINTIALFVTVIAIGFSAFSLNIIRSSANPPINEAAPDNVFSFISYLNRDQYGSPPLLYGRTYASKASYQNTGKAYVKDNGRYKKIPMLKVSYDENHNMLFSRMHSAGSYEEYAEWASLGDTPTMPTQLENMRFLFSYQLDWMYTRYLLWNFAGRQNDVQGHGSGMYGSWISGIKPLDRHRIPTINDEPPFLKNNKGKNVYYMLPFILGLIGMGYQLIHSKRYFLIVGLLFFFTGIAIVLYLNQTPVQPRERDYAYAGSFYAYAIWIGIAVVALYALFKRLISKATPVAATFAMALCLPAPLLMAQQNWDDHDRSNRYIARDVAYNYLMSCDPNAILFTVGDNDTFPLWYLQEVEGVRTDVRVVNLSLLAADWYIEQMKQKVYNSDALPITLPREMYLGDENNSLGIYERLSGYFDLKTVMDFVSNPENKVEVSKNEKIAYLPVKNISLPVDKQKVLQTGLVGRYDADKIVDTIKFTLPGDYIIKPQMVMLDMIANNRWERPLHFTSTAGESNLGLNAYLQFNGFSYKLTPVRSENSDSRIDSEWMYSYLMDTCRWGNMEDPKVYVDHFYINTIARILNVRGMHTTLAYALLNKGEKEKARMVIDRVMEIMPESNFPYCIGSYSNDVAIVEIIDVLYRLGEVEKANQLVEKVLNQQEENLRYFSKFGLQIMETRVTMFAMQKLMLLAERNGNSEAAQRALSIFKEYGIS